MSKINTNVNALTATNALILVLMEVIVDFQLMLTYLSSDKTDWGC